ncbi:hypothetical protein F5Y17DRAFT_460370 [Xylariaceae sp. FL0594]|nr:hypothetical protein F5Y17DRAFT_460370 [Xylariaceae sp. FL0594]
MSSLSPSSFRASWMYSDPYAYRYSDVDHNDEDGSATPISPSSRSPDAAGSAEPPPSELPADEQLNRYPRAEQKCFVGNKPVSLLLLLVRRTGYYYHEIPLQGPTRTHDDTTRLHGPHTRNPGRNRLSRLPSRNNDLSHSHTPPAYADGLIPVDASSSPSSDFDAILRNMNASSSPVEKKKKGGRSVSRERGSRYYDRYSSNFG